MPTNKLTPKTLEQIAQETGRYPLEAFEFVRSGLNHTVTHLHGPRKSDAPDNKSYHVSGQQLCWGLRDYAIQRYGIMAGGILHHWGIVRTNDFGRIVFIMIDSRLMAKTDDDDVRDFDNVYDFAKAFSPPTRPASQPKPIFSL